MSLEFPKDGGCKENNQELDANQSCKVNIKLQPQMVSEYASDIEVELAEINDRNLKPAIGYKLPINAKVNEQKPVSITNSVKVSINGATFNSESPRLDISKGQEATITYTFKANNGIADKFYIDATALPLGLKADTGASTCPIGKAKNNLIKNEECIVVVNTNIAELIDQGALTKAGMLVTRLKYSYLPKENKGKAINKNASSAIIYWGASYLGLDVRVEGTEFIRNLDGISKAKITVSVQKAIEAYTNLAGNQGEASLMLPLNVTAELPKANDIGSCQIHTLDQKSCDLLVVLPKDEQEDDYEELAYKSGTQKQVGQLKVKIVDSANNQITKTLDMTMSNINLEDRIANAYTRLSVGLEPEATTFEGQVSYAVEHWNKFLRELVNKQGLASLIYYTSDNYLEINRPLLKGNKLEEMDPKIAAHIRNIDSVLAGRLSDRDYMVSRYDFMKDYTDKQLKDLTGHILTRAAYMSATLGRLHIGTDKHRAYLRLRIPQSYPVAWIKSISTYPYENEFLLARGSRVHVQETICVDPYVKKIIATGIEVSECGTWEIFGDILPMDAEVSSSVHDLQLNDLEY